MIVDYGDALAALEIRRRCTALAPGAAAMSERISPQMPVPGPARAQPAASAALRRYNRLLLAVAGLGGLLYGIDVGIIGGALPYLEATSRLTAQELSSVVAAVLLGSVISTLFSGLLADWMGRKPLMVLSGCAFVASIPAIALSHGLAQLLAGRLLQGISAGIVGVVVPLYLAECLGARERGRGTAVFQWLLTLGFVLAALLGVFYSYRIGAIAQRGDAAALFAFKDEAWRRIFWASMAPGILFVLGVLRVTESPRWLYRRGAHERAGAALRRSRPGSQAAAELEEMARAEARAGTEGQRAVQDSLWQRRYLLPFLLACLVLFCNTATGINSIIGYNTAILLQSGLSDLGAHWGYVIFTIVNFLATTIGMTLVDRSGRRFLLILGASGVIVSLAGVGLLFRTTERQAVDAGAAVQALAGP
ncbi:MAG: MFS transporter, partial [Acidobacteriota bacterium]